MGVFAPVEKERVEEVNAKKGRKDLEKDL